MSSGRIYVDVVTIGSINVYTVNSDPSGALSAPQGSLAIRTDTAQTWQNRNGGTTWTLLNSGLMVSKRRIQLADLPANVNAAFNMEEIPADSPMMGGFVRVTQAPTGGGVTTCTANVMVAPGQNIVELQQLVGATNAQYINPLNNASNALTAESHVFIRSDARTPLLTIAADVNLDTLATFDVTFFVVYGGQIYNL
jgi:hypothetical protein